MLENMAAFERALNLDRDNDGFGIAPLPDFLSESLIRKKDNLPGVSLWPQPMLQYRFVCSAADRGIDQLGAVCHFTETIKPGAIHDPYKMLLDFK